MTDQTNGAEILDRVSRAFETYTVQATPHAYVALALYCVYTHAANAFQFAPRLLLTSAEKRSGKSRTLDITTALSRNPLVAANATVPAIFRSIDPDTPRTLVFDEADTIFGTKMKAEQNEDLRGLINAGFQMGTPVLRTVGPNHTPTEFQTFAPVVMAAIGSLPDTITDRAVNIRLRRRKPTEIVSQYRIRRDQAALHALRVEIAEWIEPYFEQLADAEPENPLEDRAADLWEPLLAVADIAGGDWPECARIAAIHLSVASSAEDADHSRGLELLSDIRAAFAFHTGDFIGSTDLLNLLHGREESRWAEERLTARGLSDLLRAYGIKPGPNSLGSKRGYHARHLDDVFARYLSTNVSNPSEPSETPQTHGSAPDGSKPSDTSNRQTHYNVSELNPRNHADLTLSDGSDTSTGRSAS